jgi:hypothetical protein
MKKIKKTQEEIAEDNLKRDIEDLRNLYGRNIPSVFFEVGERVQIGNLDSTIISEVLDDGQIYVVDVIRSDREGVKKYKAAWSWTEIEKYYASFDDSEILYKDDGLFLNYSQRNLSAIFSNYYYFGLDLDPVYQRELVWTEEDKVNLIDSIFHRVDIGKFLFIRRDYYDRPDHKSYEVIDGKQRITALIEFYENRFSYKGKFYKDLHPRDKHHFKEYSISFAEVKNITEKQIYQYFLKVNTCGKVVSQEHLNKVKELLENCDD